MPAKKVQKARKKAKKVKGSIAFQIGMRWWLIGILAITFITFIPSLNNEITNWDDPDYVSKNQYITKLDARNINTIFTQPIATNYHPLTILSLGINYQIGKLNGSIYHWTNLLLHLLNTLLVFFFVFYLSGKKKEWAIIAALLFAIHPMHVESVAWISGRKDVLFTAFFIGGLIMYLRYLESKNIRIFLVMSILFLLSLLSKPSAVTFPVVLLLIDWFQKRKWERRIILEKLPLFALSVIFGLITIGVQSETAVGDLQDHSLINRIFFASYGIAAYVFNLFLPLKLAALHPYPLVDNIPILYKVSPLFVLLLLGAVGYSIRFTRIFAFGFVFFLINIALTLQFMQVGSAIISERYTYLSYVGLFIIVAFLIDGSINRKTTNKVLQWSVYSVFALFCLFFMVTSFNRCKVWKNSETLWNDALEKYPRSAIANNNLGFYQMEKGEFKEALDKFNIAVQVDPDYYDALISRGVLYRRTNQFELALKDNNAAISLRPEIPKGYNNRGNTNFLLKRPEEALQDFLKAIELNPNYDKAYGNAGALYRNMGQIDKAMQYLDKAIQINPRNSDALMTRGNIFAQRKNSNAAIRDFSNAIRFGPTRDIIYFWRGVEYNKLKDFQRAISDFNTAIQINPNNPDYFRARSAAFSATNNSTASQQDLARAKQLESLR